MYTVLISSASGSVLLPLFLAIRVQGIINMLKFLNFANNHHSSPTLKSSSHISNLFIILYCSRCEIAQKTQHFNFMIIDILSYMT
jgi:hypothetical protein